MMSPVFPYRTTDVRSLRSLMDDPEILSLFEGRLKEPKIELTFGADDVKLFPYMELLEDRFKKRKMSPEKYGEVKDRATELKAWKKCIDSYFSQRIVTNKPTGLLYNYEFFVKNSYSLIEEDFRKAFAAPIYELYDKVSNNDNIPAFEINYYHWLTLAMASILYEKNAELALTQAENWDNCEFVAKLAMCLMASYLIGAYGVSAVGWQGAAGVAGKMALTEGFVSSLGYKVGAIIATIVADYAIDAFVNFITGDPIVTFSNVSEMLFDLLTEGSKQGFFSWYDSADLIRKTRGSPKMKMYLIIFLAVFGVCNVMYHCISRQAENSLTGSDKEFWSGKDMITATLKSIEIFVTHKVSRKVRINQIRNKLIETNKLGDGRRKFMRRFPQLSDGEELEYILKQVGDAEFKNFFSIL
ncbi:hypothetical protein FACS1894219_04200 [Clostridia bacterium]|nr:hypothetical protein FACS1894219_04200 [Clostridia bacterium]